MLQTSFIHSFIHQWHYSPLLRPGLFFSFVISFTQSAGLLGRVISPSQGRYLNIGQHKHRKKCMHRHQCLQWNSNPRSQRSSERRPRGHCDRRFNIPNASINQEIWRASKLLKIYVGPSPPWKLRNLLCSVPFPLILSLGLQFHHEDGSRWTLRVFMPEGSSFHTPLRLRFYLCINVSVIL
jgi:hypothetical protein